MSIADPQKNGGQSPGHLFYKDPVSWRYIYQEEKRQLFLKEKHKNEP